MSTEITGRHFDVTPEIRDLIETKLAKIRERLFDDIIETRVVLQVEKYRNICEIIIVGKEHDVKSIQESEDSMQDAINTALDHIKRQAQKNREKIRDHHRKEGGVSHMPIDESWNVQVLEPGNMRHDNEAAMPRVIQTNNLPIRPMSIEHAALLLDDSKNEFIVFRDVDTDRVSVIYKRRDNNLGLIQPEF
jgi:putative sigma-54 modulation protein